MHIYWRRGTCPHIIPGQRHSVPGECYEIHCATGRRDLWWLKEKFGDWCDGNHFVYVVQIVSTRDKAEKQVNLLRAEFQTADVARRMARRLAEAQHKADIAARKIQRERERVKRDKAYRAREIEVATRRNLERAAYEVLQDLGLLDKLKGESHGIA